MLVSALLVVEEPTTADMANECRPVGKLSACAAAGRVGGPLRQRAGLSDVLGGEPDAAIRVRYRSRVVAPALDAVATLCHVAGEAIGWADARAADVNPTSASDRIHSHVGCGRVVVGPGERKGHNALAERIHTD